MRRRELRLRVLHTGDLQIVDPGPECRPLLQDFEPATQVVTAAIPGFTVPRFQTLRQMGSGYSREQLSAASNEEIWQRHSVIVSSLKRLQTTPRPQPGEASVLELNREIVYRLLKSCALCEHRCGVDRTMGERGVCGLGMEALAAEHLIHIGEEAPINPSLVINLAGCGLRCRYCQQGELLAPELIVGDRVAAPLWDKLCFDEARSLSFAGGNPDESLYAILGFLNSAPEDFALPIIWNLHSYSTSEVLQILHGVVDVYVPDLKYGSRQCGQALSGVHDYPAIAQQAVTQMLAQDVLVIVRILVLPGHLECCHIPTLEFLAALPQEKLLISVLGQYVPDWKINDCDGRLSKPVSADDVRVVRQKAEQLGLNQTP